MAETLYATFSDPQRARETIAELRNEGVKPEEISLLMQHEGKVEDSQSGVDLVDTRPTTPLKGTSFEHAFQPLGNDLRQLSVPEIEPGVDVELNPAQMDYPMRDDVTPTEFSTAPPNALRDYNKGLETDNYNKHYDANVSRDMAEERRLAEERRKEALEATPYEDMPPGEEGLRFSRGYNAIAPGSPPDVKVDPDADAYRDADIHPNPHANAKEVGHDTKVGAEVGLGVGAIAALAVLLVPGLGLVVGGGPIAAAAIALAAGVGTGAAAGAVTGLLQDQGLSIDAAERLNSVYDKGGAILAVTVTRPETQDAIRAILNKHGAAGIESHQAYVS